LTFIRTGLCVRNVIADLNMYLTDDVRSCAASVKLLMLFTSFNVDVCMFDCMLFCISAVVVYHHNIANFIGT